MRTILFLAVLCLITASILETGATPETSPKKTNASSKTGPASPGKPGPPSPGKHGPPSHDKTGPPSPGKHGPPSHDKTGPPSPGKHGPPSHDKTGPPSPGKHGPPSHDKTGPPSPGKPGPPSHGKTGPPSDGKTGPPSPGKHGPAAGTVKLVNSPSMKLSTAQAKKSPSKSDPKSPSTKSPIKSEDTKSPKKKSSPIRANRLAHMRIDEHHSSAQATPPNSPDNKSEQLDNEPEEELENPGLVMKVDKSESAPKSSNSPLLVDNDDDDDDDDDDSMEDHGIKLAEAPKSLLDDDNDDDGDKDGMDGDVDSASNESGSKTATMRDNNEVSKEDPFGADDALKEPVVTE
uniref:Uncharacterized protein n=1 Tax=Globodera rostochiensis TaxID=31243 RepID=A0A914HJP7_GLORO